MNYIFVFVYICMKNTGKVDKKLIKLANYWGKQGRWGRKGGL